MLNRYILNLSKFYKNLLKILVSNNEIFTYGKSMQEHWMNVEL